MSKLLTSYGPSNKVMSRGRTQTITCETTGAPIVTIIGNLSGEMGIKTATWYRMTCNSTASYSYVGMTYTAATQCRDAMINKYTRNAQMWEYVETSTLSGGVYYGWRDNGSGIVQEADVTLVPTGGHMYQVNVAVNCKDVKYTTSPQTVTWTYPQCMADDD